MEKKGRSWACTFVLQVSLSIAFYLALNLGQPQKFIYPDRNGASSSTRPLDVYFLSVSGGYRPLKQQNLLLKKILLLMKMEKVANFFKARFVVNVSELGEDDPLAQNASWLFPPQKVPWYSTKVSNDGKVGCFLEHFNITRGKMLTVVGLDTGSFQVTDYVDIFFKLDLSRSRDMVINFTDFTMKFVRETSNGFFIKSLGLCISTALFTSFTACLLPILNFKDSMLMGSTSDFKNSQLNWLTQSLEATTDSWIIVSGYHPVVICDKEQLEAKQINGPLQNIFMKHGVNAYMSRQGCSSHTVQGGVAHIGIADPTGSEPLVHLNGRLSIQKEMINDGFLLHRVGSLEITTYFVSSAGEIVNEAVIKQHVGQMGKVGARLSWRGDPDVVRWEIEIWDEFGI
ncbi:hypothetical protein DKX38_028430 [Salix brachista]|uniref:Uncharacterized protein n=1 Tax=Salix brachista TaxID=2182728 RepID=A0A5N5J999_9ROSI|nr:hypothetical protein DKX38_028430 [Salix brachista]